MTTFESAPVISPLTETLYSPSRGQNDAEISLSLASHRPADVLSSQLPTRSATKFRPAVRIPALQFVTITQNPEVERKLNTNRHTVRSAAMKHAIINMQKEGKRLPKSTNKARQNQVEPPTRAEVTGRDAAQAESDRRATEDDFEKRVIERSQTSVIRSLSPFGTVTARANSEELDLASFYMRKMKSPCSIFFHMVDIEEAEMILIPMALNMPIIYHAMLYMASVQYHGIDRSYWSRSRSPIIHEAVVIKSVQQAIASTSTPSEEIIFGTTMFGVSQLIFDNRRHGRAHLQGVAQMIRLKGGLKNLKLPFLRNFLEWLQSMHMLNLNDDGRLDSVIPSPYGDPQLPADYPPDSTPPRDPRITFQRLVVHRVLDADLAAIVDRLACANYIDKSTWEKLFSTGEILYRDHLFAIKNDLCSWQPTGQTGYAEDDVLHIGEAVRLAALLYFRLRFGFQQEHKAPARTLALQLQQELMRQRGRSHIIWILYHGCYNRLALILWMLYCGGIFTKGSARKWFVDQIKGTAGIAGTNWSSTRAVLMKFMFNGEQCEAPMKKLFDESEGGPVLDLHRHQ